MSSTRAEELSCVESLTHSEVLMRQSLLIVSTTALLSLSTGCGTILSGEPSVRSVADRLEQFPLGTPYADMVRSEPQLDSLFQGIY
jgi:hypothetical protein